VLLATGFFRPRELEVLRDAAKRASKGRKIPPPEPDADRVEMAGEMVSTGRSVAEEEVDGGDGGHGTKKLNSESLS